MQFPWLLGQNFACKCIKIRIVKFFTNGYYFISRFLINPDGSPQKVKNKS